MQDTLYEVAGGVCLLVLGCCSVATGGAALAHGQLQGRYLHSHPYMSVCTLYNSNIYLYYIHTIKTHFHAAPVLENSDMSHCRMCFVKVRNLRLSQNHLGNALRQVCDESHSCSDGYSPSRTEG
jgi:hypothetical protein